MVYTGSGFNIVLDLVVFALPIPKILGLNLSTPKKTGTCMVFLVGLFVTVCSIVRLNYVVRWRASLNPTWNNTAIGTWSLIEIDVGIICACMPALSGRLRNLWRATIGRHTDAMFHAGPTPSESPEEPALRLGSDHLRPPSWTRDGKFVVGAGVESISTRVSDELELVDKDSAMEFASQICENL